MTLSYHSHQKGDTIAAIATAPGDAAIAIVRISGDRAIEIVNNVFSSDISTFKSHTAHYGKILHENGDLIDNVLLLVMLAPKTYTGEDSVEIYCHGGSIITKKVLERVLQAGCRMAQPGEFSLKAFLNGKIDLAQAEAIQELIGAQNELALRAAEMQLDGSLSQEIARFQHKLTEIGAILEAWVDFPEEDLAFAPMEEILLDLTTLTEKMEKLHLTFQEGKILKEGLSLCLSGLPNVGKSSLMNALLGKDRAIVTEIAGTTRDLLEEDLYLAGLHFRLTDTAGLRDTSEIVEKEGIRRSKLAMEKADLILFLLDASREISKEENELLYDLPKEKSLVIWNKVDLGKPKEKLPIEPVFLSAKERIGLDELKARIHALIWKKGPPSKEEVVLTQIRHKEALSHAIQFCLNVKQGLQNGASPEFLCIDIRQALESLAKIIGTNVSEDILSMIFSKFCLGK